MALAERRSEDPWLADASGAGPCADADAVMPCTRRRIVVTLATLVVLASGVDVVRDGDHWPFSSYSMFAELRSHDVRMKRLVGIAAGHEVEIVVPRDLAPFHEARLLTAFRRLGRRDDAPEARRAALLGCLDRYEALRRAGAHDGPVLDELRFYKLT